MPGETKKNAVKRAPRKAKAVLPVAHKQPTLEAAPKNFIRAIGRRKEAVAQVRLIGNGTGIIKINGRDLSAYFPIFALQQSVLSAAKSVGLDGKIDISAHVRGGGLRGQAEAVRLGIARAMLAQTPDFRKVLRSAGLLTRDARVKERKKYGLRGARRAPQWAKR